MSRKSTRVSRQERREQVEQERKRRNMLIGGGTAVVAVVLIVLIVIRIINSNVEGALKFGAQDRGHDTDVVVENTALPPVGGVHDPAWQNCGVYAQPVDSKNALHSMEHGAVWIAYQPDLSTDEVASLRETVGNQSYLLMAPYPNLANKVVLTAWGVQLAVDSVEDERIDQFISVYRNGPQTPEPGASCSGGVGVPLS